MIYELRIYHMHPGRLPAICERFGKHTLSIFPKHGITVTDFWVDAQGAERIYYVCEFESVEAQQAAWASFRVSPEWIAAREQSEESGPIVERVESYTMERAGFFAQ